MEQALEIRGLTKHYSGFSLENVTLSLPQGCVMGLIGENGAGKSTTIKLILDLVQKDTGEIRVLGKDLAAEGSAFREQLGVVMDECNFPGMMKLGEAGRMMRMCYRTWDQGRFEQYVKKFALPMDRYVKDFSRGMKMKLSIAVALSHASRLLILDEATSGLDPVVRDEILDIFLEFMQDETHSIFISSHILSDLEKICDYVTFLHEGRVVFSEEKETLLEKYAVVKCSAAEMAALDPRAVVAKRENSFGVEALVLRSRAPESFVQDPASIEDIMVYYTRFRKA